MKQFLQLTMLAVAGLLLLAACNAEQPAAPAPTSAPPTAAPAAEQPDPTPTAAPNPDPTATEQPQAQTESGAAEADAPAADAEQSAPVGGVRNFVVVPEQSRASYIAAEEFFGGALDRLGIQPGLTDTIGSTQEVTGQMQLDVSNPASPAASGQFVVDLRTLTSDQSRRDDRIRDHNLESNRFPLAEFTMTTVENLPSQISDGEPLNFTAAGEMTIREITQPVTFDVTATFNGAAVSGVASTRLKMTDFGFEPPSFANIFAVEDEFTAQIEFTLQEQ